MRFGLLLPHFGDYASRDRILQGSIRAEELGFDSVWVRDHLVFEPHGEFEAPNREFYEQQSGGKLKLPKCNACSMMHYPPRTMCPDCRSTDLGYAEVSGKGTIHSYVILSEPIHPAFHPHPNAPIALIEIDEAIAPDVLKAVLALPHVRQAKPLRF